VAPTKTEDPVTSSSEPGANEELPLWFVGELAAGVAKEAADARAAGRVDEARALAVEALRGLHIQLARTTDTDASSPAPWLQTEIGQRLLDLGARRRDPCVDKELSVISDQDAHVTAGTRKSADAATKLSRGDVRRRRGLADLDDKTFGGRERFRWRKPAARGRERRATEAAKAETTSR